MFNVRLLSRLIVPLILLVAVFAGAGIAYAQDVDVTPAPTLDVTPEPTIEPVPDTTQEEVTAAGLDFATRLFMAFAFGGLTIGGLVAYIKRDPKNIDQLEKLADSVPPTVVVPILKLAEGGLLAIQKIGEVLQIVVEAFDGKPASSKNVTSADVAAKIAEAQNIVNQVTVAAQSSAATAQTADDATRRLYSTDPKDVIGGQVPDFLGEPPSWPKGRPDGE